MHRRHRGSNSATMVASSKHSALCHVSSSSILDGTVLDRLVDAHIDAFQANGCDRLAPELTIPFCTMCSGGEVIILALKACERRFNNIGINITFKHMFSCESDAAKIKWIKTLLHELGIQEGRMLERIEKLGEKDVFCLTHKKRCVVPDSELTIAGTSCKDLSKAYETHDFAKYMIPKSFKYTMKQSEIKVHTP